MKLLVLSMMLVTSAFAAPAATPAPAPSASPAPKYHHIVSDNGPVCLEQVYGCVDEKCAKPVLLESKLNECKRTEKAKAAMGNLADKWTYLRFDHMTPPPAKGTASNAQNVTTTVKDAPVNPSTKAGEALKAATDPKKSGVQK